MILDSEALVCARCHAGFLRHENDACFVTCPKCRRGTKDPSCRAEAKRLLKDRGRKWAHKRECPVHITDEQNGSWDNAVKVFEENRYRN